MEWKEDKGKTVEVQIEKMCLHKSWDENEHKTAHLLLENVIFLNNGHWVKDWPKDHTTIHVNCNDVFGWGCADAEDILHSEIGDLYEMWKKDSSWGPAVWCILKRKQMPQEPVEKLITDAGIWNLKELLGINNEADKVK